MRMALDAGFSQEETDWMLARRERRPDELARPANSDGGTSAATRPTEIDADETALLPTLIRLTKATRVLRNMKLAEIGFYSGQDELLLELGDGTPKSVKSLAERLDVRPSTVSKMINCLIAMGLVERRPCEDDARQVLISVTPQGVNAGTAIRAVWSSLEAEMTNPTMDPAVLRTELATLQGHVAKRLARLR